jgi:DNA-binding CsgD family transcriptional regulator
MATQTEPRTPTLSLAPYLYQLKQVTGAEMVFGGLARADAPVVLDTLVGERSDGLRDLQLTSGFGLGGKVVQTGRPLQVRDYYVARDITRHYDSAVRAEALRAILAVPVRSAVGVHGVIYAGVRHPTFFGERLVDRAVAVSRAVTRDIAIEDEVNRRVARAVAEDTGPRGAEQRLRDVHADLAVIRDSASGDTRRMIEDLMHRLAESADGSALQAGIPRLSGRELDVVSQAAAGHRNAAIGERLGLAEGTVKAYLFSATRKLGVTNRVEAVTVARRLGLIP